MLEYNEFKGGRSGFWWRALVAGYHSLMLSKESRDAIKFHNEYLVSSLQVHSENGPSLSYPTLF